MKRGEEGIDDVRRAGISVFESESESESSIRIAVALVAPALRLWSVEISPPHKYQSGYLFVAFHRSLNMTLLISLVIGRREKGEYFGFS